MPTPATKRYREKRNSLEGQIVRLATSGVLAKAGQRAIRAQRRKGIPITLKRGSDVVKIHADGREEILAHVEPVSYVLPKGVRILSVKRK